MSQDSILSKEESKSDAAEIKHGVIQATPQRTKFLKVPGVTGQFGNVVFDNDNITKDPVSPEDEAKVKGYFKGVEELDSRPASGAVTR